MVLLGTDEAGDQDTSQVATDVTRSIFSVLFHTVMAVPVTFGNG